MNTEVHIRGAAGAEPRGGGAKEVYGRVGVLARAQEGLQPRARLLVARLQHRPLRIGLINEDLEHRINGVGGGGGQGRDGSGWECSRRQRDAITRVAFARQGEDRLPCLRCLIFIVFAALARQLKGDREGDLVLPDDVESGVERNRRARVLGHGHAAREPC